MRQLEQALLRQDDAVLTGWLRPAVPPPSQPDPPQPVEPAPPPVPAVSTDPGKGPLVGRHDEREAITQLLTAAGEGQPGVVQVVGEAGAGKSRLVDWAMSEATHRNLTAVLGTCSADDGAPPLWPWRQLLSHLGLPAPPEAHDSAHADTAGRSGAAERAFATHDAIARALREAAAHDDDGRSGLLLVLDDLHWADTPTLRCLAHVVMSLTPKDRVAIVVTRRPHTTDSPDLAELDATLARHGARTLELHGLTPDEAHDVVTDILGAAADAAAVQQWRERTDGNPFFLVELAREAARSGRLDGEVPASVQSLVRHRVGHLAEPVRELLLIAAALGRRHPPLLLARVADLDPDELLDRLEPAHEAGILHSRDGLLTFDHALTRDAVLAMSTPNRVARTHARIARTLEAAPVPASPAERAFDLAHHWLAAGPLYAASAWPAAAAAGALAADDFANVEAADLLQAALGAHAVDPQGTAYERFDLLLRLNESAARAGMWREAMAAVSAAVAVARGLDDPGRVAAAVAALTRYSVWTPMEYGVVDSELVDDLRATLGQVGPHDSTQRCTVMLALAAQLYYLPGSEAEVEALVDEGMAMARRLAEPRVLAWAARTAYIALWRSRLLERRRALAVEEVEAARASGDVAAEAVALTGMAGAALEAADLATWESASTAALAIARRRRLSYVEFALRFVELNLDTLRGGDGSAEADALRTLNGVRMSIPATDYVEFGIAYVLAGWDPVGARALVDGILAVDPDAQDEITRTPILQLLAVAGDRPELERLLPNAPLPSQDWSQSLDLAILAFASALAGDAELSGRVADALAPLAGGMAVAGIASVQGPVDCFLAMALSCAGDKEAASAAADRGEVIAREWGFSAFLDRFVEQRRQLGF